MTLRWHFGAFLCAISLTCIDALAESSPHVRIDVDSTKKERSWEVDVSTRLIRILSSDESLAHQIGDPNLSHPVSISGYAPPAGLDLIAREPIGTEWAQDVLGDSKLADRLSTLISKKSRSVAFPAWSPNGDRLASGASPLRPAWRW